MRRTWVALSLIVVGVVAWLGWQSVDAPRVGEDGTAPAVSVPASADGAGRGANRGADAPPPAAKPIPEGTAFVVHVVDAAGAPIPNATVSIDPLFVARRFRGDESWVPAAGEDDEPIPPATSGGDGRAAIGNAGTGRWRISAEAPGFARNEVATAWVEGSPPRPVRIRLEPAHTLQVIVRDSNGALVEGVTVQAAAWLGPNVWPTRWSGVTGSDGACELTGLPRGYVRVGCEGGEDQEYVRIPDLRRVDLIGPATPEELAAGTATLRVRVVDRYGAPVRGASVRYHSSDRGDEEPIATAPTDADGQCSAKAVADYFACVERIDVHHPGFATHRGRLPFSQTGPGGVREFPEIVLQPGADLSGTVVGPEGPVPDARVSVWVEGPDTFGRMEEIVTRSDEQGRYSVTGLSAGPTVLEASAYGLDTLGADQGGNIGGSFGVDFDELDKIPATSLVEIEEGVDATRDIQMIRTGPAEPLVARLSGVVRREDGTPVPWADVGASGATGHWYVHDAGRTVSGPDGTFELTAEAASGFRLWARGDEVETDEPVDAKMTGSGSRSGIVVEVRDRFVVHGTVRSSIGLPVVDAVVTVGVHHHHKFSEATHWTDHPESVVRPDGTFRVSIDDGLHGGDDHDMTAPGLVLCVRAHGHAASLSAPFTREDLKDGKTFDIELGPGVSFTGRLVGDGGTPLADCPVRLVRTGTGYNDDNWPPRYGPDPWNSLVTRTGSDGSFRIDHLLPTEYALSAHPPGTVGVVEQIASPASPVLHARSAVDLAGVVVDENGAPVAASVRAVSADAPDDDPQWAEAGEDGAFRFTGIASGSWQLQVHSANPAHAPLVVDGVRAGDEDVRLQMKRGLRVEARLLGVDGAPLPGVEATFYSPDPESDVYESRTTAEDGSLAIEGLLPGDYSIRVGSIDLRWDRVRAGTQPVLQVPGTATLSGRAMLGDEGWGFGAALGAVRERTSADGPVLVHLARFDRSGAFEIGNLSPGRYLIVMESGGLDSNGTSYDFVLRSRTVLETGTGGAVILVDQVLSEGQEPEDTDEP